MVDKSKRFFLSKYLPQLAGKAIAGFQDGVKLAEEEENFEKFFESYESSHALTLAYPNEILLDSARKAGIEIEGREKSEIVKELLKKERGR
jgi:hypothetical protein